MPAYSFEGLEQEVAGPLRVALAEVARLLVAAARGEEVGVRRAVLEAEGQRVQQERAV